MKILNFTKDLTNSYLTRIISYILPPKNLVEFLTVVTRNPDISLSTEDALSSIKDYENVLKILYPSKLTFAKFKELLNKYKPTGLKVHDYEIASISLANKIEQIVTFNVKDFEDITEIKLIKL